MRLVAQNVRAFPPMRQSRVVSDVQATAADAGAGGVILWQEMGLARYRRALRGLGDGWAHYIPTPGRDVPISWRADRYKLLDAGVEFLHPGHRLICHHRYISWVILRNTVTGMDAVFTNRHYVPGAYARGFKPWRKWRVRAWEQGNARDQALIERFLRRGLPVAGGGDYNVVASVKRPYGPRIEAGNMFAGWVNYHPAAGAGVMWLWSVNTPECFWKHTNHYTAALRPRYSDHEGRVARLHLTRRPQ